MGLANIVLEGGGVRGIGLIGALMVAQEQGYTWNHIAGTSAGAMIGALLAAGYTAAEIKEIMEREINLRDFMDKGWEDRLPLKIISGAFSIWKDHGLFEGDFAIELMNRLLYRKIGKPIVTFEDLPVPCCMIASDITNRRMLVLPDDLYEYGVQQPRSFPVSHAVRASMSIPLFFEPYQLHYHKNGVAHTATLVDGGLLSNFPVWLFDPQGRPPEIPTIGFLLQEPDAETPSPTGGLLEYLRALISTAMEARDAYTLTHQDYERTIAIPTGDIRSTEFDISPERRAWLLESGRKAATSFFARFSFSEWISAWLEQRPSPPT